MFLPNLRGTSLYPTSGDSGGKFVMYTAIFVNPPSGLRSAVIKIVAPTK